MPTTQCCCCCCTSVSSQLTDYDDVWLCLWQCMAVIMTTHSCDYDSAQLWLWQCTAVMTTMDTAMCHHHHSHATSLEEGRGCIMAITTDVAEPNSTKSTPTPNLFGIGQHTRLSMAWSHSDSCCFPQVGLEGEGRVGNVILTVIVLAMPTSLRGEGQTLSSSSSHHPSHSHIPWRGRGACIVTITTDVVDPDSINPLKNPTCLA